MRVGFELARIAGLWLGVLVVGAALLAFTPLGAFFLASSGRGPISFADALTLSFWVLAVLTVALLTIVGLYALWHWAKRRRRA